MAGISSLWGTRSTAQRRRHHRTHHRAAHRNGCLRKIKERTGRSLSTPHRAKRLHAGTASQLNAPTPTRVKGIVNIRADTVLENADLLGRVLTVLIGQWGLDVVEVHIAEDKPGATGVTNGNGQYVLTVAGHSFPFVLEVG